MFCLFILHIFKKVSKHEKIKKKRIKIKYKIWALQLGRLEYIIGIMVLQYIIYTHIHVYIIDTHTVYTFIHINRFI